MVVPNLFTSLLQFYHDGSTCWNGYDDYTRNIGYPSCASLCPTFTKWYGTATELKVVEEVRTKVRASSSGRRQQRLRSTDDQLSTATVTVARWRKSYTTSLHHSGLSSYNAIDNGRPADERDARTSSNSDVITTKKSQSCVKQLPLLSQRTCVSPTVNIPSQENHWHLTGATSALFETITKRCMTKKGHLSGEQKMNVKPVRSLLRSIKKVTHVPKNTDSSKTAEEPEAKYHKFSHQFQYAPWRLNFKEP